MYYDDDGSDSDYITSLFKGFGVGMLITFSTASGLLIVASKVDGQLPYNTFALMIIVEIVKSVISAIFQLQSGKPLLQWPSLLYAVPSFAYMITDNLSFVLLTLLDPATMNVLWNSKVVWTAILMYFALGTPITRIKWGALALLTFSLIVCEVPHLSEVSDATSNPGDASPFVLGLGLTMMGTLVVSGGNVTCEYLMKKDNEQTLFWQNFQLYTFGILFNVIAMGVQSLSGGGVVEGGFFEGMGWWTVAIVLVQSFSGMCIGAVIKYLDNVAVIYCHSVSMFLTTVLGRLIFGFEVSGWFVTGIVLCSCSLKMYYYRSDLSSIAEEDKQRYAAVPGLVDLEDDELAGLGFEEGDLDIDIDDLDQVIAELNDIDLEL